MTTTNPPHFVLFHAVLLGLLAAWPQASGAVIRLVDVAEQAGITLLNICGGPSKDYIVEVNGNGAAFFDYDNDSDMDVLIVNGSTLANIKYGGDPMVALFRNDGKGRFADVTPASRLSARGWGMGRASPTTTTTAFKTSTSPHSVLMCSFTTMATGRSRISPRRRGVGDPRWSTNCAFGATPTTG
jgi:hypothetical protein